MKIPVIYIDGTSGAVSANELDYLIQKRRIFSFYRSSGWARIRVDTLRGVSNMGGYKGKERRKT
jgi:hypothetical protein